MIVALRNGEIVLTNIFDSEKSIIAVFFPALCLKCCRTLQTCVYLHCSEFQNNSMRSVDRPSRSVKRPRRFVDDEEDDEDAPFGERTPAVKEPQTPTATSTPNAKFNRVLQRVSGCSVTKQSGSDLSPTDASSPYSKRDRQPKTTSDEFIGGMQALIPKVRKLPLSPVVIPSAASPKPLTLQSTGTPTVRRLAAEDSSPRSPMSAGDSTPLKKTRGRKPKQPPLSASGSPLPRIPPPMSPGQPASHEPDLSKSLFSTASITAHVQQTQPTLVQPSPAALLHTAVAPTLASASTVSPATQAPTHAATIVPPSLDASSSNGSAPSAAASVIGPSTSAALPSASSTGGAMSTSSLPAAATLVRVGAGPAACPIQVVRRRRRRFLQFRISSAREARRCSAHDTNASY
jgi:hypothetical protein